MISEELKIKINQFILSYERQCSEIQYSQQNIKQNVMLSILQKRNHIKNTSNSDKKLQKSIIKVQNNNNLASSKQTKFSEQRYQQKNQINNFAQDLQKSSYLKGSKILQKSNISIKSIKSLLTNNFVNQQQQQTPNIKSQSRLFQKKNILQKETNLNKVQVQGLSPQDQITFNSKSNSKLYNNVNMLKNPSALKYQYEAQPKQLCENNLAQSKLTNKSSKPIKSSNIHQQKIYDTKSNIFQNRKSNVFQGRKPNIYQKSKLYPSSQSQIKANPFKLQKDEQQLYDQQQLQDQEDEQAEPEQQQPVQQQDNQQQRGQNYPTFQKPSFQFITNLDDLRQSDPSYVNHQQNQYEPQHNQTKQIVQNSYQGLEKDKYSKWNHKMKTQTNYTKNKYQQNKLNEQNQNHQLNDQQDIDNLVQNQSLMQTSNLPINTKQHSQIEQKRNFTFQINMQNSQLTGSQKDIQELRKKKILQLQRRRQQRMQNLSRQKNNPSQISKAQTLKGYRGTSASRIRKESRQNRDSLNKSHNEKEKPKNLKVSRNQKQQRNQKQDNLSYRDSAVHDNRTVMSKYVDQSRVSQIPSSPFVGLKSINTQKRPPNHKNRREQPNIFAGESSIQKQRSSLHKLSSQPQIEPKIQRSSFQKKSNQKLMINSLTYVCLPGELNRRQRQKLIDVLEKYQNQFFVFLFKQYSRKVVKGIYLLDANQTMLQKIYGDKAPEQIYAEQIQQFYRFDSGSRQFKKVDGCKSFSFSIHAVDLK